MVYLSHIAVCSVSLASLGVFIAAYVLDRWYVTTEDSLSTIWGYRKRCERNDCQDWQFDDGPAICPYGGGKLSSTYNAGSYLYFVSMGLTFIAAAISFATACFTMTEKTRIGVFGGIILLVLLSGAFSVVSGGLFYYIVKELIFCGHFCDFAITRNSSISCTADFDTSFVLWGLGTTLQFCIVLFGSILRLVDKSYLHPDDGGPPLPGAGKNGSTNKSAAASPQKQNNPVHSMNEPYGEGEEETPNEHGHVGIPDGYVWDEGTSLYWSDADEIYLDGESKHYWDPNNGQWYNPETGAWYD